MSKSGILSSDIYLKVDAKEKISHGLIPDTGRILTVVAFQSIQKSVKLTLLEESDRSG